MTKEKFYGIINLRGKERKNFSNKKEGENNIIMNRITFNKLNIKQQDTIKTIKYNDCTIEVLQSLPTRDINDFIYAVLAKSEQDDGTYNEVLLNAYFHLYLYKYYFYTKAKRR